MRPHVHLILGSLKRFKKLICKPDPKSGFFRHRNLELKNDSHQRGDPDGGGAGRSGR